MVMRVLLGKTLDQVPLPIHKLELAANWNCRWGGPHSQRDNSVRMMLAQQLTHDDAPRVPPWNAAGMPVPPSRSESKTQARAWAAVKQPTVLAVKCVPSESLLASPPTCLDSSSRPLLDISNLQISANTIHSPGRTLMDQSSAVCGKSHISALQERSTMHMTHLPGLTHLQASGLQASGLQTSDLVAAEYSMLQESSEWLNKEAQIVDRQPFSFALTGLGHTFDPILEQGAETILDQSLIENPSPPPRALRASCKVSTSVGHPAGIDLETIMSDIAAAVSAESIKATSPPSSTSRSAQKKETVLSVHIKGPFTTEWEDRLEAEEAGAGASAGGRETEQGEQPQQTAPAAVPTQSAPAAAPCKTAASLQRPTETASALSEAGVRALVQMRFTPANTSPGRDITMPRGALEKEMTIETVDCAQGYQSPNPNLNALPSTNTSFTFSNPPATSAESLPFSDTGDRQLEASTESVSDASDSDSLALRGSSQQQECMHALGNSASVICQNHVDLLPRSLMSAPAAPAQEYIEPAKLEAECMSLARLDMCADRVIKTGWLLKETKGSFLRSCQNRWCVVKYGTLQYFHKTNDKTPAASINLSTVDVNLLSMCRPHPCNYILALTPSVHVELLLHHEALGLREQQRLHEH
jgi:hypothetical protein